MPLTNELPDYLPARMLNEYVYCPRLFYYEWVEGVFAHNRETIEGALRHAKIDGRADPLAPADELGDDERIHARSVTLSSEFHHLIATLDLVEAEGNTATPVDYKRGAPRQNSETGELLAWDPDRVQLAVQAIVLRENGYACDEGVIFYVKTRQRVRVPIDSLLLEQTLTALDAARAAAALGNVIPPPLEDSPKCPHCSLVGICLPDETRLIQIESAAQAASLAAEEAVSGDVDDLLRDILESPQRPVPANPISAATLNIYESTCTEPPRPMIAARDDLKPLYLNGQGLYVGKSGNVLKVKERERLVQEVRIGEICQVNLFGNIQLSTQAIQTLCDNEVPIAYFTQGAWFYGMTHGLGARNVVLRKEQFRLADDMPTRLAIARSLVSGKIRNQRTMLQRNHVEPPAGKIAILKELANDAERAESLPTLLGIEGNAARIYFELFPGLLRPGDPDDGPQSGPAEFSFDFTHRNRRPPRDPVNALLSLAYSVLAKDLMIVCHAVGFDPFLGFYHQPRFGRAPLALDLMEPFRPLIADSAVLSAINTKMVKPSDFIRVGNAVALTPNGRKGFFRAYEQRMDTLATHPLFGYRLNYRRMLEIQTRLLARLITGEIDRYPVFTTR